MSMTTDASASTLNLPSFAEISLLVEDKFMHDWILRIEHFDLAMTRTQSDQWQAWGEPLFAVRDASTVIDSIVACRTQYPAHSIRLHAEKLRPRTQMYYPVYTPDQHGEEELLQHQANVVPARIDAWLSSLGNAATTMKGMALKVITIAGMLLVSLLMLEEVVA